MRYPLGDISEASKTKDKLMLEAAVLFARRGYHAVTMRDIADQVHIRAASIYNHFVNKEELFHAILNNIKELYMQYFDRLEAQMQQAASFEQVLDCLFSELTEVYQIFIYFGISLITTEQFRDGTAREIFNEVYIKIGKEYTTDAFKRCIQMGWVKEFDAEALAILFMNSVVVGTLMRTHEAMGHETVYDTTGMFMQLRQFMLDTMEAAKQA